MNKISNYFKSFSLAAISNFIVLCVGIAITFIFPKFMGVTDYGYWQLFALYETYSGVFHIGIVDGVYLKAGGMNYKSLDTEKMSFQFRLLFVLDFLVGIVLCVFAIFFVKDSSKQFVVIAFAVCLIFFNLKSFILHTLQATNKINNFASINIFERLVFCILAFGVFCINKSSFKALILAEVISQFIGLINALRYFKNIAFNKNFSFSKSTVSDALNSIKCGINLTISGISAMLITGIVRFAIEAKWNTATFGKISMTITASNIISVFIRSVSIVLYPVLRNVQKEKYTEIYNSIRSLLLFLSMGILVIYYPMKSLLVLWLPQYTDALKFIAILLPMCIFDSKNTLLTSTYFKTLRMEKTMLLVDVVSAFISFVFTIISVFVLENLMLSMVLLVCVFAIKSFISEALLAKKINIKFFSEFAQDIIMSVVFAATSWFIDSYVGTLIYFAFFAIYVLINRKAVVNSLKFAKQIVRANPNNS